jgi:hypothetical protein
LLFEVASDCGPVLAVQSHVVDILRNLVTNAFEAIPEGGTVTIRGCNLGPAVAGAVRTTLRAGGLGWFRPWRGLGKRSGRVGSDALPLRKTGDATVRSLSLPSVPLSGTLPLAGVAE